MRKYFTPIAIALVLIFTGCGSFGKVYVKQFWYLGSRDYTPSVRPTDLNTDISSVEMDGNRIRMFVHVMDSSNTHYRGIPAEMFCYLRLQQQGQETAITNYTVREHRDVKRKPGAFAFVLDYSGSMESNKPKLYAIMKKLIESKPEGDAYSITRYGERAAVDAQLTEDRAQLQSFFPETPATNIGGSTATWDGLAMGVETLENAPYESRTLVVFTDGEENASKITKQWAFWKAKNAGVRVITISLGKSGEVNMKELSENTGGMYSYLNDISEIENAYTSIENKAVSYYEIEFETPYTGLQMVTTALCGGWEETFSFNNSPAGIEPQRLKDPVISTPPVTSTTTPGTRGNTPTPGGSNTGRQPSGSTVIITPPGTVRQPTNSGSSTPTGRGGSSGSGTGRGNTTPGGRAPR